MADQRLSEALRDQRWLDLVLGVLRLRVLTKDELDAVREGLRDARLHDIREKAQDEDREACAETLRKLRPLGLVAKELSTREGQLVTLRVRGGSAEHLLNRSGWKVCKGGRRIPRNGDQFRVLSQDERPWFVCRNCQQKRRGINGVKPLRAVPQEPERRE